MCYCHYQLKLICVLHVLLKLLLLLYLKKLIRTNKLLFLSIEIYMHVSYFVKTLIVILFKIHVICFVKIIIVILSKEIDNNK